MDGLLLCARTDVPAGRSRQRRRMNDVNNELNSGRIVCEDRSGGAAIIRISYAQIFDELVEIAN